MKKKRSQRMKPIVEVAESREREAARQLGIARQQLQRHEQQLQELMGYREEYAKRFEQTASGGINTASLLGYRRFLSQLNDAIEQQHGRIERARADVQRRIEVWREKRGRLQAMEKVTERYRAEEFAAEERAEQLESDERGQRYRG